MQIAVGTEKPKRAERIRTRPWTDPRVLIGVLLVLVATVVGARAWSTADDSDQYWALARDVRAGDSVERSQFVATSARLDGNSAGSYVLVADEFPAALADLKWKQDAVQGSLLASNALVSKANSQRRQLPIGVTDVASPADLARGDRVQVWVGSRPGEVGGQPARMVLADVRVVRTGAGSGALEGSGTRKVLVEVEPNLLNGQVLSAVAAGYVTLVRIP